MSKLDIIVKVLNEKYIDSTEKLQEKAQEVNMTIDIRSRSRYKLYKFCPTKYKADHFARVEGLSRMCDYFLFIENGDKLYAFIIELKKSSGNSAIKQLDAGECFVNYILDSAIRIGEDIKLTDCIIRKIKIKSKLKNKTRKGVEFDNNGYCSDYSFSDFNIDFILRCIKD
ncbi:MAG: hypothetical protein R3Y59_00680 [bacterium]